MKKKIKIEKGNVICPRCRGVRRFPGGFICETCDAIGQIPDKRRWICQRCGAVHQYKAAECGRCDSKEITEMDNTHFGNVDVGDIGWRPRRLAVLIDRYGDVDKILANSVLLAEAGLEDVPLPQSVVQEARRLDREKWALIQARIARIKTLMTPARSAQEKTTKESAPRISTVNSSKGDGKRNKIFDHPVTAVIRWMGKEGWEFKQANAVLKKLGVDMAPSTIHIQLRAGLTKDKSRGEPAELTMKQELELERMS